MPLTRRVLMFAAAASRLRAASVPAPFGALPSKRQLAWHRMESYAFLHFTTNTFTDKEWGYGDEPERTFHPTALDARQWARVARVGAEGRGVEEVARAGVEPIPGADGPDRGSAERRAVQRARELGGDEGGDEQELVGHRIQPGSEAGALPRSPRDEPVQRVGQARHHEGGSLQKAAAVQPVAKALRSAHQIQHRDAPFVSD